MSLVRLNEPGPFSQRSDREDAVQAEGCPVKTITFPLPATQTEISLDIGSPSFRYVDDRGKVGANTALCKARYMNDRGFNLPDYLETQLESFSESTGRSRGQIVADAVENYLLGRARWDEDMEKALADARNGIGYDGGDVLEWMESWGEEQEKPLPRFFKPKS